jgi:hypothetical protein
MEGSNMKTILNGFAWGLGLWSSLGVVWITARLSVLFLPLELRLWF